VLIFGGLWGMIGLLFAIPLATLFHAVIKVWMRNLGKDPDADRGLPAAPVDGPMNDTP
jgi:putative permease